MCWHWSQQKLTMLQYHYIATRRHSYFHSHFFSSSAPSSQFFCLLFDSDLASQLLARSSKGESNLGSLPQLTRDDYEVNAPVTARQHLLQGEDLLRALDQLIWEDDAEGAREECWRNVKWKPLLLFSQRVLSQSTFIVNVALFLQMSCKATVASLPSKKREREIERERRGQHWRYTDWFTVTGLTSFLCFCRWFLVQVKQQDV